MYRLLIVDDEPYTADGLQELFADRGDMELEVYKAYSAFDALDFLHKIRIDIVLTDIEMPELSGLDLQRRIAHSWPRCKVVFLTGYHHFHYAQASIRHGAVDYVLKTEDDEQIVGAVRKAYDRLNEEMSLERTLTEARRRLVDTLPMLRRDYLLDLLQGGESTAAARARQFAELEIPLSPDEPVLLLRARVDRWPDTLVSSRDRALMLYSIQNIVDEYFAPRFVSAGIVYDRDNLLWLLQPKSWQPADEAANGGHDGDRDGGDGRAAAPSLSVSRTLSATDPAHAAADDDRPDMLHFVCGMLEAVQASCRQFLKLSVSFAVGSEPGGWDAVARKFDTLDFVFIRGLGAGGELLLTDRHIEADEPDAGEHRHVRRHVRQLEQLLERDDGQAFLAMLEDTLRLPDGEDSVTIRTAAAMELFYALAAMFMTYLNRSGLTSAVGRSVNLGKLFAIDAHAAWDDTKRALTGLAELIFANARADRQDQSNEIVRRVHAYIDDHLDGDLSLVRLAEVVHLSPSYLSRLHRETVKQGLTSHILDKRLARAKELLLGTNMKIHEIGARSGYESPPYFNRFFKKMTNMTPQEYREQFGYGLKG